MPISFSLSGDGGAVSQQSTFDGGGSNSFSGGPSSAAQSSGGVAQGGNALDYGQALANRDLGVIDTLNKLTGGVLQGYIDRTKKEQYAQGMAQAAQGKALIDIENDQPWYTKLYGPDATTQGAQAFNVAAAMQDAQSQFMQAMPQLREKSPDQVRQYLVNKMGEVQSTGDPRFDAMVQQGLAEQLPRMLSTHMSQYMQYTQEQNYNGFTNLGTSSAASLQNTLKASNNITDEDMAAANAQFTNTLVRPDNMTEEAYQRGLRDIAISSAQNGNWAAVRALRGMPEYGQMPTQMKDNLEVQLPRLEQEWALKNPAARNLFTSRADLQYSLMSGASGLPSSQQGHAQLDGILDTMEDSNRQLNGDSAPVYTNEQRAHLHLLLDKGNAAKVAQTQKAALGQLNYDEAVALALSAINNSSPASLSGLPLPDGAKAQAADTLFAKATSAHFASQPDAQANMFDKLSAVADDASLQSPHLKQILGQQMNLMLNGDSPLSPDAAQALQYADALRRGTGGEGSVMAYMGDSMGPKVISLLNTGYRLDDPEQLKAARKLIRDGGAAVATVQDIQDAQRAVAEASPGWFKRMMPVWGGDGLLTAYSLTDGNKRVIAQHVAPLIAQYKKAYAYDDDTASRTALSQVLRNADLLPGAFILNNRAFGARPFFEMVNREFPGAVQRQSQGNYQEALKWAIDQQMEKAAGQKDSLAEMIGVPRGPSGEQATLADALAGRVHFNGYNAGYDPSDWHVDTGENLGNGFMTLFMTNKDGAQKMVNINAKTVAQHMKDTLGNTLHGTDDNLGLSGVAAFGPL